MNTRSECFICGKPPDERLGELTYQMFVAAHDTEAVYVHRDCVEPLQAIEENLFAWLHTPRPQGE